MRCDICGEEVWMTRTTTSWATLSLTTHPYPKCEAAARKHVEAFRAWSNLQRERREFGNRLRWTDIQDDYP